MCFDTGTVPAIGYSRTITGASVDDPDVVAEWDLLVDLQFPFGPKSERYSPGRPQLLSKRFGMKGAASLFS